MTDADHESAHARLKSVADNLGEVFDSVQIIVTMQEGDEPCMITVGSGSFHARWASVREVAQDFEHAVQQARDGVLFPEGEDPDE